MTQEAVDGIQALQEVTVEESWKIELEAYHRLIVETEEKVEEGDEISRNGFHKLYVELISYLSRNNGDPLKIFTANTIAALKASHKSYLPYLKRPGRVRGDQAFIFLRNKDNLTPREGRILILANGLNGAVVSSRDLVNQEKLTNITSFHTAAQNQLIKVLKSRR